MTGFDSPRVHHVNGPIVQWQNTRLADEGWRFDSARVHQVSKCSSETHNRQHRSGIGFRNGNFWTVGLPLVDFHYAGFAHSTTKLNAHKVSDAERQVHVESNSLKASGNRWQVFQVWADGAIGKRISSTRRELSDRTRLCLPNIYSPRSTIGLCGSMTWRRLGGSSPPVATIGS